MKRPVPEKQPHNWATSWQNQQNGLCAQRRLGSAWASTQSDQSSLCAQWVAEDSMFLYVDSEDSDQTGRMPRLIWVFTGRKGHFVGFVMRWLNYYHTRLTMHYVRPFVYELSTFLYDLVNVTCYFTKCICYNTNCIISGVVTKSNQLGTL